MMALDIYGQSNKQTITCVGADAVSLVGVVNVRGPGAEGLIPC